MAKPIAIGCHSAFWGDTPTAARQLVMASKNKSPVKLDYLVSDYLAEVTMAILAQQKKKNAKGAKGMGAGGYIQEFVRTVWKPLAKEILSQGIKVVTNAGGLNPEGLKTAIEAVCKEQGLPIPVVACVLGDDVKENITEWRDEKKLHSFQISSKHENEPFWTDEQLVLSSNAYLGAQPIRDALAAGAQIVVTGRCADSAMVLGPLMHEYGWKEDDYDLLSAGSLVGHIIECGCQTTGGNTTDWKTSYAYGWRDVGFPIALVQPNGVFDITKPDNTGGVVSVGSVVEQLVYEIQDPAAYILPDVVCDWSQVQVSQGARGYAATPFYKVSTTVFDGYIATGMLVIAGDEARQKALAVADGVLQKVKLLLKAKKLDYFTSVKVETIGAEELFGAASRTVGSREVTLRITVTHPDRSAMRIFMLELAPTATGRAPGITGAGAAQKLITQTLRCEEGRRYLPTLTTTARPVQDFGRAECSGMRCSLASESHNAVANLSFTMYGVSDCSAVHRVVGEDAVLVLLPLSTIAFGRSGDKGDSANIGIVARDRKFLPYLDAVVTEHLVSNRFGHVLYGQVKRYAMPGISGFNFILSQSLGGGDRQGKTYAQQLLSISLPMPLSWAHESWTAGAKAAHEALLSAVPTTHSRM